MSTQKLTIIADSREQQSYDFSRFGVEVIRGCLKTGDYSAEGHSIAIERKELNDLISCLTKGRDRFERELERAMELDFFAVIVESTLHDVAHGRYTSKMRPKSALQSVYAMSVRYKTSFLWCGNRAGGEYTTYSLIQKYVEEQEKNGRKRKSNSSI